MMVTAGFSSQWLGVGLNDIPTCRLSDLRGIHGVCYRGAWQPLEIAGVVTVDCKITYSTDREVIIEVELLFHYAAVMFYLAAV